MTKITSQVVAQGSYGLTRINPRNGVRIGNMIKVWHVMHDGKRVNTSLTRDEARSFVALFCREMQQPANYPTRSTRANGE